MCVTKEKHNHIMKRSAAAAKSLQSRPTLCNPIDGSPPDSPVPGIFQARTVEWMATHSSIHAWRIPWTEEPGGLQSIGLQTAGHD